MSSKYSENSKKPPPYTYEKLKQTQLPEKCQGSCSCNNGQRSAYDRDQAAHIENNVPINFPIVKNIPGWK